MQISQSQRRLEYWDLYSIEKSTSIEIMSIWGGSNKKHRLEYREMPFDQKCTVGEKKKKPLFISIRIIVQK